MSSFYVYASNNLKLSVLKYADRHVTEDTSRASLLGHPDASSTGGGASATFYTISVDLQNVKVLGEVGGVCYQIDKRYSDFFKLYTQLKARTPVNSRIEIFNFPKKSLFNSNSKALKEERKGRFEEFLRMILGAFQKIPAELEEFIDIKNHLPIARSPNSTNVSITPSSIVRVNTSSTTTSGSSTGSSPAASPSSRMRTSLNNNSNSNINNNSSGGSNLITTFSPPPPSFVVPIRDEFDLAVRVASSKDPKDIKNNASNDQKLQMYGLFKYIKEGGCDNQGKIARPGMFDVVGRAKFDSWVKVSSSISSTDTAMREYVNIVRYIYGDPLPGEAVLISSLKNANTVSSATASSRSSNTAIANPKNVPKKFPDVVSDAGQSDSSLLFSPATSSTLKSKSSTSLFSPTPTTSIVVSGAQNPSSAADSYDSLDSFNSYTINGGGSRRGSSKGGSGSSKWEAALHLVIGLALAAATYRLLVYTEALEHIASFAFMSRESAISIVALCGVFIGTFINFLSNHEMILD